MIRADLADLCGTQRVSVFRSHLGGSLLLDFRSLRCQRIDKRVVLLGRPTPRRADRLSDLVACFVVSSDRPCSIRETVTPISPIAVECDSHTS